MILTKIKRVTKSGLLNFWRDRWISLATILIVIITLFSIGGLIFARAILISTLDEIQDKVDISVYFKMDAGEEDILALKDYVNTLNEVKNVEYITRDKALEMFEDRHQNNDLIVQSLEEIGENPLGAILNVKAKETSQYEGIAKFLDDGVESGKFADIIDKINYHQNKLVIDRLSKILDSARKIGFGISIILVIVSIIITFNTIRMAIYTNKEEIGVMRLVGASNRFISGPFVIEGVACGLLSSLITMGILYPLTNWLGPLTQGFFGSVNISDYYSANFLQIFLILSVSGIILGSFSSLIAVRRYLKV